VLAQVHCHQHAVLGWDAEATLLGAAGAQAEPLASGCCGLAGNFGFQPGHADVSRALAEQVLLPRLRDADPAAVILADGFSCRTQVHELDSGGREATHLAELLAAAQAGDLPAATRSGTPHAARQHRAGPGGWRPPAGYWPVPGWRPRRWPQRPCAGGPAGDRRAARGPCLARSALASRLDNGGPAGYLVFRDRTGATGRRSGLVHPM
jgi:hypothetical protein